MHQQSQLQFAITSLSSSKLSPNRLYRNLTIIAKTLDSYNNNPQVLPSQRFIPCCLFTVPDKLHQLLQLQANTILQQKPQKMGYRLLLGMYLKGLVKLLTDSAEQIRHIIIQGMSRSILLAAAYQPIIKKWIKILLEMWSTSNQNLQISLRCHIALSKYLSKCDENMYMWSLRRMYVSYFQNCKQVSWRNFQHINFMINSMCQIVKFNTQRAYYVLFGYLRSIALELDKFHKSKRRQKVQLIGKLFSNQILNCFKLFTAIVTRVDCQDFTALIYPLCEMFATYERVTQSPEYIPLKLHLLEYQLTIIQTLGIFIPHTLEIIEKLIKCQTFNKKIAKKSQKIQANIQLAYKVSKAQLTQALLINQLFRSLITKIYWFQSLMCKAVYGPEVIQKLKKIMKSHKFLFSQYQQQSQKAVSTLKHDSQKLYEHRLSQKMSLHSNKKLLKFQQKLKQQQFQGPQQYKKLKQDQQQLLRDKLAAQQQQKLKQQDGLQLSEQQANQDQDEVNSGWQQASQGASEMDMKQVQGQEDEEQDSDDKEDVSYQGDPQDAEQAAKQWSEEEWSSQNDINEM